LLGLLIEAYLYFSFTHLIHERILRFFGTMEKVGKKAVHEGMLIFRRHFECHHLMFETEDESIFLWRVDDRTATPDIDRIRLIEDVVEKEAVFLHLRVIGEAEGGAKDVFFVMEIEVGGVLIVVAGETGAHFWRMWDYEEVVILCGCRRTSIFF
jgi:hypothetical protein